MDGGTLIATVQGMLPATPSTVIDAPKGQPQDSPRQRLGFSAISD